MSMQGEPHCVIQSRSGKLWRYAVVPESEVSDYLSGDITRVKTRTKLGRPPGSADPVESKGISLPKRLWRKIDRRPEGRSAFIRRLVEFELT